MPETGVGRRSTILRGSVVWMWGVLSAARGAPGGAGAHAAHVPGRRLTYTENTCPHGVGGGAAAW